MGLSIRTIYIITGTLLGYFCNAQNIKITVKNSLGFDRAEVVAIKVKQLRQFSNNFKNIQRLFIKNNISGSDLPVQWIDNDIDGKPDELLFYAFVPANGMAIYNVTVGGTNTLPVLENASYARYVPERSDDFAWENDKVAFRVYGPKGQEEALAGVPGSTLSSGIDIWLKKVSYPIINKWYANHLESPGYYHTDHGEGYDPYHVGSSRGTGGIGIWVNDSLQVSKNFISYKIIASGPLRSVFELTYAPYSDYSITETKRITLDAGSNFSKFEVSLLADKKMPNYSIGITLHTNKGEVKLNREQGWFRHWEAIDDSFVGEGIVIDPDMVTTAFTHISKAPDQSNLLVVTKPATKLTYYAGFAWQKSGQISSKEDWDAMLERQALIIANPLTVTIEK